MKKLLIFLLIPIFVSAQEIVDINNASLEELQTITGIGSVYSQRIIDARPFSSIDDLLRVNGIGEKTLQKIKDQGLAYVESQPIEKKVAEDGPPQSYPGGIIINKIMPSPEGADADKESAVPTTKLRILACLPLLMS